MKWLNAGDRTDMRNALSALSATYQRLQRAAQQGNASLVEQLLNQAIPVTDADKNIAASVQFFASVDRRAFIEFTSWSRQPCLLLLLDEASIMHTLGINDRMKVWSGEDNLFHVSLLSRETPAATAAPRPRRRGRGGAKPTVALLPAAQQESVLRSLKVDSAPTPEGGKAIVVPPLVMPAYLAAVIHGKAEPKAEPKTPAPAPEVTPAQEAIPEPNAMEQGAKEQLTGLLGSVAPQVTLSWADQVEAEEGGSE